MKYKSNLLTPRSLVAAMVSVGLLTPVWAGAAIAFPTTPLAATSSLPQNVLLALSVEYPTVGTAYNGGKFGLKLSPVDTTTSIDPYFDPAVEYVGYWRSDRCYDYDTSLNYFVEAGATANMQCSGAGTTARWSGNFLNWGQSSAIDIFRSTLSGGYRYIDTATLTVLERATLNSNVRGGGTMPTKEVGIGYNTLLPVATASKSVDPSLFTPYAKARLRITPTDTQFYIEAWNADNTNKIASANFYARVKACDATYGAVASNCTNYGTSVKPTGEIQTKSNSLRFSAFGYLIDNVPDRDGGVLRAGMRSVGSIRTTIAGVTEPNPQREWASDGTFVVNPDAAAEGNSGVLNYLNKFGLVSGYKGYDPVGELYGESLQYLMHKSPRSASTSGMTTAMKDGFPVDTTWADPIQGACQQNFVLVIGDTNTHCDGRVSGGQENNAAFCGSKSYSSTTLSNGVSVNANTWTDYIGDFESPARSSLSTTQTGSGGHGTFHIAGLSYFAHVNNIRPDIANSDVRVKTYVVDVDETSSTPYNLRQYWYAAKYGGFDDKPTDADKANASYRAVPDTGEWEAASSIPGFTLQPKTYFLASNGKLLQSSLRSVFEDISAVGRGSPKLSASANRITSTPEGIFSTTMDTATWTGDLTRKNVTYASSAVSVNTTPTWQAATILNGTTTPVVAANPLPASRKLFTYDPLTGSGVSLTWASIPATFKTMLQAPYSPQTVPQTVAEGQRRLDWLTGVRTEETVATNPLRARISLLGDAGSGSPLYVGAAGSDSHSDLDYFQWASGTARMNRTKMVYLGTSEGMLHGFDAATGIEKLAYVPSRLFKKFAASADKNYTRKPMVDVSPVAVDVKFGTGTTDWRTLLVGGLGSGGKGAYALDVTNPSSFSSSSALWEFTEADDADVGNITSTPFITRLADGRFVVMFGSGYNNSVASASGDAASSTGNGFLYVLLANKGGLTSWTSGTNFIKVRLGTGTVAAPAGVGGVNASRDTLGFANRVYLGDLDGSLWRVDVPPIVSGVVRMSDWPATATHVFTASVSSTPQPITAAPALVFHPNGGIVALFGTGKMLETADRTATLSLANSFYGVWDKNKPSAPTGAPNLVRTDLVAQTLSTNTTTGRRTVSGSVPDWATRRGWYIDLSTGSTNLGERVIYPANVDLGSVDFTTQLNITACNSGSGYFMTLDPVTGLMTVPSIDVNGDGNLTSADLIAGLATKTAPGQVSVLRLSRPSDPYAPVGIIRSFGADLVNAVGNAGISGVAALGLGGRAASKYGRLNYRQITEIKR